MKYQPLLKMREGFQVKNKSIMPMVPILFTLCRWKTFLTNSPYLCSLFSNSELNDHPFFQYPFTWHVWVKLFHLINLSWVAPFSILDLIVCWRSFLLRRKAKKIWNLCLHALPWAVWKERNRRLFKDIYGDLASVQDFFLFFVAS